MFILMKNVDLAEERLKRRFAELCKLGRVEQYVEELRKFAEGIGVTIILRRKLDSSKLSATLLGLR